MAPRKTAAAPARPAAPAARRGALRLADSFAALGEPDETDFTHF
jgi:hypothetical protein